MVTTPIASGRHEKFKISEFKPTQHGIEILNMDLMQLAEDFDPNIMKRHKAKQKKRMNGTSTQQATGQVWASSSSISKKKAVQFPNML